MSTWVDVHLVLDSFDRQFNMWRNAARLFARTEFVMMLDVDFAVCTDFRKRLLGSEVMLQRLREGYTAFVVPAFEFVKVEDGRNQSSFPKTKKVELLHPDRVAATDGGVGVECVI
jgi:glycosyltransferase-like protein LARGE